MEAKFSQFVDDLQRYEATMTSAGWLGWRCLPPGRDVRKTGAREHKGWVLPDLPPELVDWWAWHDGWDPAPMTSAGLAWHAVALSIGHTPMAFDDAVINYGEYRQLSNDTRSSTPAREGVDDPEYFPATVVAFSGDQEFDVVDLATPTRVVRSFGQGGNGLEAEPIAGSLPELVAVHTRLIEDGAIVLEADHGWGLHRERVPEDLADHPSIGEHRMRVVHQQ